MTIADDFSVAVNGNIRHDSGSTTYTVLEMHRFLQDLADDASASGNDLVDITSDTPSDRSTDNIITLLGTYNIDDDAAEYLFAGSITQDSGNTVYSGLRVLGAVNNSATQLVVVQNNQLYPFTTTPASPFWGTQGSGGLNGDATSGVLMRVLIKSRDNGADIDGKRVRVQARHWGDTYDFFNVTLGQGESVAAVGTTPDAQNDTSQGTVTAYTHVVNSGGTANAPTGGFQAIDLNNGNGSFDYYSQWTYGVDTSGDGLKGIWEYIKDLSGNTSAKTIDGINGELFLGVTHDFPYTSEATGPFTEREVIAWGVIINYDGGTSMNTPTEGDRVVFSGGSAGQINQTDAGATSGTLYVTLDSGDADPLDDETFIVYDDDGAEGGSGVVFGSPTESGGGTALLLALDDNGTTGNMYIQLLTGTPPPSSGGMIGSSSSATADAGTVVAKTVPKIYLGSYTGTVIGAYGIGFLPADIGASDTVEPLVGASQTPPNNVVFTVSGLVSGEDRVLVGPRSAGVLLKAQFLVTSSALVSGSSSVTANVAIPTDTPSAGSVRIESDSGVYLRTPYSSYSGSVFTFTGTYGDDAAISNDMFISYIDTLAGSATATFTSVYLSDRDLFVRVRDGGGTPIKTFEAPATLSSSGGSVAAIRTTDE